MHRKQQIKKNTASQRLEKFSLNHTMSFNIYLLNFFFISTFHNDFKLLSLKKICILRNPADYYIKKKRRDTSRPEDVSG